MYTIVTIKQNIFGLRVHRYNNNNILRMQILTSQKN